MIPIIILIVLLPVTVNASTHSREKMSFRYDYIVRAIDEMHKKHYDNSLAVLDTLEKKSPYHPSPYFYKACVYEMIMQDMEDNSKEDEFLLNTKKCQRLANDLITNNPKDLWARYYLAYTYGLIAIHKARNGGLIEAFRLGLKGYNIMLDIIKHEEDFYDAYGGVGMFLHWKDIGGGFLAKNTDIEKYLNISIEKGLYSSQESRFVLLDVYLQRRDYINTAKVAIEIRALYEEDPWLPYILSLCAYNQGDLQKAIDYSNQALKIAEAIKPLSKYNIALFNLLLARAYKKTGQDDKKGECLKKAQDASKELSDIPETRRLKKEIREGIDNAD